MNGAARIGFGLPAQFRVVPGRYTSVVLKLGNGVTDFGDSEFLARTFEGALALRLTMHD